jgi:hypothetical protein
MSDLQNAASLECRPPNDGHGYTLPSKLRNHPKLHKTLESNNFTVVSQSIFGEDDRREAGRGVIGGLTSNDVFDRGKAKAHEPRSLGQRVNANPYCAIPNLLKEAHDVLSARRVSVRAGSPFVHEDLVTTHNFANRVRWEAANALIL